MVKLHVKRGDQSCFLLETTIEANINDVAIEIAAIFNGQLKVNRICYEMEELSKHGTFLPVNMQGLTEEQIDELHLKDEWGSRCIPSGGFTENKDSIGRRNGKAPLSHMAELLSKTISEAKAAVSKKQVDAGECLTQAKITETIDLLRGAIMIVYSMGLPPFDPIRMELENQEDLSGTCAAKEVVESTTCQLWLAGKELNRRKKLKDYLGSNEKTKAVIKLQKHGEGPPGREPAMSEEDKKQFMLYAYKRQEEMKKLAEDSEDAYLNSAWADNNELKRSFHGVSNISWRPK